MDALKRRQLERLARASGDPCVSVYIPTHPTGPASEQDAIRLKNCLGIAERQLASHGLRAPAARSFLEKASWLANDTRWWQQRSVGLATFIAAGVFESYRLSIPFSELVVVANRFRIRPLVPLLNNSRPFYILQLSQKQVQLFSADEQSIEKLDAELPGSLREALNYDGADRGEQVHSGLHAVGGKQAAVFHGQGGQPDAVKDDLLNFCRLVDKAVTTRLAEAAEPLLLACVDYLAPIYRKANTYNYLLEQTLSGNQEYNATQELHRQAVQLVGRKLADSQVGTVIDRYRELAGTGKTTDDIPIDEA